MGLFEDIGRKVETFKQRAEEASREQASAECADCGELIYTDRDACPECGGEEIVPRTKARTEETAGQSVDDDQSESESDDSGDTVSDSLTDTVNDDPDETDGNPSTDEN